MSIASISKIVTRNYKNIKMDRGIDFGALTILIGANGSGKSNLISLFQFLRNSTFGVRTDEQRGRTKFEDAVFWLGGPRILDGFLTAPATVSFEYVFKFEREDIVLGIDLLIQDAYRQVVIVKEYLDNGFELSFPPAYYRIHGGGSGSGVVSVSDYPKGRLGTLMTSPTHLEQIQDVPANELALSELPRLLESRPFAPEAVPLFGPRGGILDASNTWKFYNANNMNLERIRLAVPKLGQTDSIVSPEGENLALVLYNLIQEELDFDESVNLAIKEILPSLRKVRGVPIGRYTLAIEFYFEGRSEPFYLSEMSDGTIRMLCWAVILHSPKPCHLIVIDEPELGIHPAWMPILAEWIKVAAQRTQVIISTHSPDLLDHFTDQLGNACSIYAFQPDTESPSHHSPTRLTRDAVSGWLEEGWQLGDLYRVGNPAVGGWPW